MLPAGDTEICSDLDTWAGWLAALPRDGRAHVLVDAAVAGSATERCVHEVLDDVRLPARRRVVSSPARLDELSAEMHDVRRQDVVIGLGGGVVMDRAKLLALLAGDSDAVHRLRAPQRCGMVVVPFSVRRQVPLTLLPTTLGTGAERSRSACLEDSGRKRLVFGDVLRTDSVVYVTEATDSLPPALVAEGVLEALLRVTMPYVGSLGDLPEQDRVVEQHAVRLVQLGDAVRAARDAGRAVSREVRRETALISGATHDQDLIGRRDQYCDVSWPLANELSMAVGGRKLLALAAVAPAVWRRVAAGDARLGSARRLDQLWQLLRRTSRRELNPAPAEGLAELVRHWGIAGPVGAPRDADSLARAAAQAWGRGLPMLKGLSVPEITSLYVEALSGTGDVSASAEERRDSHV